MTIASINTRNKFYAFKTTIISLLLCFSGIVAAFSQDYLFDTEIIGVEDGLPHRNTYDIIQDKEGFIWVSTLGRISRYDGYNFKTYSGAFLNTSESSAIYMATDLKNRLWYCWRPSYKSPGSSGIIDTRLDSIYSVEAISEGLLSTKDIKQVSNSGQNLDDVLIFTHSGILYKYNDHFEEIYRLPEPPPSILMCREAPDGSYWIGNKTEVIHVQDGKRLKTIPVPEQVRNLGEIISTHPNVIIKTLNTPEAQYWILEENRFVPFSLPGYTPKDVKGLIRLHKDYIVYAVKNRLLVQDKQGNIIYGFDGFDSLKPSGDLGIEDILSDRQDNLWIATGNGILKITVKKNPFHLLGPKNPIRGIYREGDRLWVGSPRHNNIINLTDGTEKEFLVAPLGLHAMSFYKDDRGHIWIGTSANILLEYIPDKDTYVKYWLDPTMNGSRLPFQNKVTKNYWIGSRTGLYRFDKANKTVSLYPLSANVKALSIKQLYQNKKDIWIATDKGIFLMDAQKETVLKHYTTADGLPADNINHIYEDKQGIFWLGTKEEGLIRWDHSDNSFSQYTREHGLSNNTIYAVYEDDFETLWLPSAYGLMAFDKTTQTTKVYLPQNGIAYEEFNTHSHFQAGDGTLYFGGLRGITGFHPATLREQQEATPPLHVNKVRVLEKDAGDLTDNTSAYFNTKKINLRPGDRILELELTLLDYEKSVENQYAYKIEREQEQWIYTRDNTLSIINPPYGKYDLMIRARGASGNWSADILTIPVHRPPPFYRRWWFMLTAVLFTLAAVGGVFRQRLKKLEKDRKRLEGEVQKRTRKIEEDKQLIEQQAEELKVLDKAKTRFFANITHEFRTPLTLVKGPIEQMIAKPPSPEVFKKRLGGMLKNTENLLDLINQLLDLSKLEGGSMKVEVSHGDIIHYTEALVHHFQPLADKKKLSLKFTAGIKVWKTHFDGDKWTKIVYNLLSNAIKFTPDGGRIKVSVKQIQHSGRDGIQLKVKDSGIGIAAGSLKHIFNRFYQADASSTRLRGGTGIGLSLVKELVELQGGTVSVKSTSGKGTEFTISLPVAEAPAMESAVPPGIPEAILPSLDSAEIHTENGQAAANGNSGIRKEKEGKLELLIIEDNAEMRDYIRSCIDASHYHISEAANGQEGIEKALDTVPDLIISDVMMPEKNGFEVTTAIRTHLATSHIPLILLTAKAALESRLEGLERGADAYLTKPFSPKELTIRIKKLIEIRRMLQERYQSDMLPESKATFKKEDKFISELKNYIEANIGESYISIEAIGRHFGISRTQCYRKFSALTDTSIADYIRSIRLKKALDFLKKGQLNVSEIAYATGFSSLSHFSKSFKKAYGKNPSEILS